MKRPILKQLKNWKNSKNRKPLILMGARQVGKTYALKEFGRLEYTNVLYLNFESTPSLCALFTETLDPKVLVKVLSIEKNIQIDPENTLIIFDEIQECPNALNSLKYFQEEAPNYHICAAGSLLGVKLSNAKGFPVGKVNFLHLYPLTFVEFLAALNENQLKNYLEEIKLLEPIPNVLHEKLLHQFKNYLFVGGMPEAVMNYVTSKDFNTTREIQQDILNAYQLDFAKHAPKDQLMRINQVWENIPAQLAKENKKFIYSAIRKGARAKDFEIALQWLTEAGLIFKAYNTSTPKLPLNAYADFDFFKVYLADVGLLGAMTNLSPTTVIHGHQLFQEFRGALIENYVAQVLASTHKDLYYWTSQSRAELDFIIQHEQNIYPIEVKSGESAHKKSLLSYAEKYQPSLLIRTSPMNLKINGNILNIPLYLMHDLNNLISKNNSQTS